jgi:hypothetical protein
MTSSNRLAAREEEPLPRVKLSSALAVAGHPTHGEWLLKPYVERNATILLVGAEGTYKSFLALHWALTVATEQRQLVVYLSAEGRGMWKRLRAWCLHHYPLRPWVETLNGAPLLVREAPVNLSLVEELAALTRSLDDVSETQGRPALLVVDTMTRNSDGYVERSNEDAQVYLNGIDQQLRARYGCTVILVHHVGHENGRARGPSTFIRGTDANFTLERPDLNRMAVTVKAGRMKDCEPPAPFELEAHVVNVDETDEDGKPVTSLILRGTGQAPAHARARPAGKGQRALLAELERRAAQPDCIGIWTEGELREIGRHLGQHKSTARDAVHGLRQLGFLIGSVGGSRLAYVPGAGTNGTKRDEKANSSRVTGDEKDESPIGLVLRPDLRPDAADGGDVASHGDHDDDGRSA